MREPRTFQEYLVRTKVIANKRYKDNWAEAIKNGTTEEPKTKEALLTAAQNCVTINCILSEYRKFKAKGKA